MTLLLVLACAVIPAAASPELRQGESRGRTCASWSLARHLLCLSGREGRGCLTQLLNLAAALAAPRRILSELAENEGLSAGHQPVTSRCLKGGFQSAFSGFY